MTTLALTELLGATVYDPSGAAGRVREVTIAPQGSFKSFFADRENEFGQSGSAFCRRSAVIKADSRQAPPANGPPHGTEGLFLLERDLLGSAGDRCQWSQSRPGQ